MRAANRFGRRTTEAELAAIVVAWLEQRGADVYQEVELIDIVARFGPELWAVEVKVSPSLAVLYQAMARRRLAHRAYVAVPYTRNMHDFGDLCREVGVGLLIIRTSYDRAHGDVDEHIPSRRWNTRPVALAMRLAPEHKTHAKAGVVGGNRWSPWRNTCEQLARVVAQQPGITLAAALAEVKHHYSSAASARGALAKLALAGKLPGLAVVAGSHPLALVPTEAR